MRFLWFFLAYLSTPFASVWAQPLDRHDFFNSKLPTVWDEALPLGNGVLGALVWEKAGELRFSLDRADLWDLRPADSLAKRNFKWVMAQVEKGDYAPVQAWGDLPYERDPAPTKLPGAALQFDTQNWGELESTHLDLKRAVAQVWWKNGIRLQSFVHATEAHGWFKFDHLQGKSARPRLLPPAYTADGEGQTASSVEGSDLSRLGYPKGLLTEGTHQWLYEQAGWGGFRYRVAVEWQETDSTLTGVWSISAHEANKASMPSAEETVKRALQAGWQTALNRHVTWWANYWRQSSIRIPDRLLERQYYRDLYKFGAVARRGAPPISLQAVWTADHGKLPPWKGDFHHDLNTQLSYWPAYTSNHLNEAAAFTDWLWAQKPTFERWTKQYFETDGLNVPGVTTLRGEPMGGWIQYSLSPTTGAWLAHHFYLQWRYTMDEAFLRERAYPFIQKVALHFDQLSIQKDGFRQLPLSSSPEIHDNSIRAWFRKTTNYDLALIRWTYQKAAELAGHLGLIEDQLRWSQHLREWPPLSSSASDGLLVAPEAPLESSHRHFSHLMAIHPLTLLDMRSETDRTLIKTSLKTLEKTGTDWWTGYSFAWAGNLYAYANLGMPAVQHLKTFADCFVLFNSFHANGTQCKGKHAKFEYRPFTLEGNFAFAAGVQALLLQSHNGLIHIFPALPADWRNVSFSQLRAEGAFLVSAQKQEGKLKKVTILSEKGGLLRLKNPFGNASFRVVGHPDFQSKEGILEREMKAGEELILES